MYSLTPKSTMYLSGPITARWLNCQGLQMNKSKDKENSKTPLQDHFPPEVPSSWKEREGSTLHRPHSPFKEVAIDGWKPLQRHGVGCVAYDLGGQGNRRRLPGGLPALVHQVQVTVHSGNLIGRERVRTVVICKRAEGEIKTWLHGRAWERVMTSPRGQIASTPVLANPELAPLSA